MSSSGMWRCVDPSFTDVSEERIASIFRVNKSASGKPALAGQPKQLVLRLQPPADAGSPLADFSTLKMEAMCSFETSVNVGSTPRHIPEDDILYSHRCENLKSYLLDSIVNILAVCIRRSVIQTDTRLFFRKIGYTSYDVSMFVEWMDFTLPKVRLLRDQ
jgi:hypothetical protein